MSFTTPFSCSQMSHPLKGKQYTRNVIQETWSKNSESPWWRTFFCDLRSPLQAWHSSAVLMILKAILLARHHNLRLPLTQNRIHVCSFLLAMWWNIPISPEVKLLAKRLGSLESFSSSWAQWAHDSQVSPGKITPITVSTYLNRPKIITGITRWAWGNSNTRKILPLQ